MYVFLGFDFTKLPIYQITFLEVIKKVDFKLHVISTLKNKSKKVLKRYCLNEKRVYFCTRNNGNVHLNTDERLIQKKRSFLKKNIKKKFVRNKNVTYLCTPRNTESSLKD